MYEWLENRSELEYITKSPEQRFSFEGLSPNMEQVAFPEGSNELSVLGQYYTAANVWWGDHVQTTVPYGTEEAYRIFAQEIAPHFNKIIQISEKPKTEKVELGKAAAVYRKSLTLTELRPQSKKLFQAARTAAMLLLEDLYRHHNFEAAYVENSRPLVRFRVNGKKLQSCPDSLLKELQPLSHFLLTAYFDRGEAPEYALLPLGWKMEDGLRNSLALRFFASFVPTLELHVDPDTNDVVMLLMSNTPMRYPLPAERLEPFPHRLYKQCLYFDIGQELVMVIDLNIWNSKKMPGSWNEVEERGIYLRGEGENFEDFDHESSAGALEGLVFLIDEKSNDPMLNTLLEAIRSVK